jgi:hypothetical protein
LTVSGTPTASIDALVQVLEGAVGDVQVVVISGSTGERLEYTVSPLNGRIGVAGDTVQVN